MTSRTLFAVIAAVQLAAWPAMAGSAVDANNAHHYQGGPKTVVPHSMRHVESGPYAYMLSDTTNGHHYNGGPKTEVPHHMGPKH